MSNPLLMLDPEMAHKIALWGVKNGLVSNYKKPTHITKTVAGITFTSPVGLSAGADKEAYALLGWSKVGFGFVEAGTVTLHARKGNPKPRVWRKTEENSVINWMGLPSGGLQAFLINIKKFREKPSNLIIGISVASPEGSTEDLETIARACAPSGDYLTLNASCPNAEHGSDNKDALAEVASHVRAVCLGAGSKPVFLKLAPTQSEEALRTTLNVAIEAGAKGFVLTNTVPPHMKNLIGNPSFNWPTNNGSDVGGYSGPRLLETTKFMISYARDVLGQDIPLIGVGGIQSAENAKSIMNVGADLIQIYTGLIYHGPKLIRNINQSI